MSVKVTVLTRLLKAVCAKPVRTTPEQQREPVRTSGTSPSRTAGPPTCAGLLQLGRHVEAILVHAIVQGELADVDPLGHAAAFVRLESRLGTLADGRRGGICGSGTHRQPEGLADFLHIPAEIP